MAGQTLQKYYYVILADFGVSSQLDRIALNDPKTKNYYLTKLVGTPGYIEPLILTLRKYRKEQEAITELCKEISADDVFKMDLFGLGSTLHFLITGQHLFDDGLRHEDDPFSATLRLNQAFNPSAVQWHSLYQHVHPDCINFIQHLLAPRLDKRPTAKTLLDHSWLKDYFVDDVPREEGLKNKLNKI